jgi:hypothetical protein
MKKIQQKVEQACEKDPGIIATRDNVQGHPGRTEKEMDALGLTRNDLKRLENAKLALRGYKQTGRGSELRWILLAEVPTFAFIPPACNQNTSPKELFRLEKERQAQEREDKLVLRVRLAAAKHAAARGSV